MNKIILITLLIILIFPSTTFATAQIPDELIYNGKNVSIRSNPLESYFDRNHPKPQKLFMASCSALWRGYLATWKIKDNYLYLVKIVEGTCDKNARIIPLSKIFPNKKTPIKATWYSGMLIIPEGKILNYVHMGYESTYEKEVHLTIENGKVVGTKTVDNTRK